MMIRILRAGELAPSKLSRLFARSTTAAATTSHHQLSSVVSHVAARQNILSFDEISTSAATLHSRPLLTHRLGRIALTRSTTTTTALAPPNVNLLRHHKNRSHYKSKWSAENQQQHQMLTRSLFRLLSIVQRNFLSTSSTGPKQISSSGNNNNNGQTNDAECERLTNSKGNKRVKIKACGRLYSELAKSKPVLFGGAPKDGILFDVQYYDSIDLIQNNQTSYKSPLATVCLLHGAPGHYKDFASLINFLTLRGIRVIAPNFPDYNATYEHNFRHSPSERLDFLLEFFKAIQVDKIDMLIGHSSAVYTMFELLNHSLITSGPGRGHTKTTSQDFKTQVKSMGLFSTPSYRLPSNLAVTPFRLFTLKLFDYQLLRPLTLACVQIFVKLQGIRNRVDMDKIEDLLIAASAVGYSQHMKMEARLKLLAKHKIPSLLVYGTNDRLISTKTFQELEASLGLGPNAADQIKRYRPDGSVECKAKFSPSNELVAVSRFESGGHYAFQRYSAQVNEDVHEFLLKRVLKSDLESTRL